MNKSVDENSSSSVTALKDDNLFNEGFLYIALRHRLIILSTAILFLVGAFLYLLKATPIYTSSSRLYVEQTGPRIMSEYEGVMTRSKNYLYTQGALLKSTPIVADAIETAQMQRFKTFTNVDNTVGYIKNNLGVGVGKADDIITVSFDSPYPQEAAQVVNSMVDSYVSYHTSRKRSTASEVLNILQKEKVKRDKELSDKFKEMLDFTKENGVVSFDNKGGHIAFERLAKLSDALTEAQLASVNAKADYGATKSMADEPAKIKQFAAALPTAGVRIFVNDLETQLQAELRRAQTELVNARYHCTEDHPSVQAIHKKIERINEQLNKEARNFADAYIEVMQLRWTTAKQREKELQNSFEEQRQLAQGLGVKAAEYSVLQSELKRTERLCEILDNRIKELNVTEDVGALNISILEVARIAKVPSKPQKAKVMAMALLMGLMTGCGLAMLRDWKDYRLRSSDEVAAVLGVPVLGVVPTMDEGKSIVGRSRKFWFDTKDLINDVSRVVKAVFSTGSGQADSSAKSSGTGSLAEKTKQSIMERAQRARAELRAMNRTAYMETRSKFFAVEGNGKEDTTKLDGKDKAIRNYVVACGQKIHLRPRSIAAEAYRTIRTAVFFGVPKGQAKTILVTSPASGDGKSTLVSNLAIAMAQAGQKTLVLDADFRKPTQHSIFEVDGLKGLSCVLAGTHAVKQVIQPGPVKGLDVLACGPEVPNPAELLNSDEFEKILKNLSEKYDRIIIDSPPVAPVADSQILSAICDITLLVLRAEKSTRRLSQQTRDGLLSVGARILGAIVNDVPRKHGRYGYGSYGYGYGKYGTYYGGNKEEQ